LSEPPAQRDEKGSDMVIFQQLFRNPTASATCITDMGWFSAENLVVKLLASPKSNSLHRMHHP